MEKNMIYTVTLNPSLDYIVSVEHFKLGLTNRTGFEQILPGGKGINVSIVLKNLGIASTALGFTAGFTGDEIIRELENTGISQEFMMEFNIDILHNLLKAFELSILLLLIGLFITLALTAKHKSPDLPIMRFACIFSNAAYMGFPLIQALFGSEGLLYASAFVTVYNILLWTAGYGIVSKKVRAKEVWRTIFTNPVLISVAAGLLIYLCQIPVPDIIKQPISLIGNMNTPLSMFITGMIIAGSDIKGLVYNKNIWYIILVRQLVIPAVCFGVFSLFHVTGMAAQVVLLLEACPSAAITSVFAVQFQYDENLAAGAVVITTFLSILTLPVCAMLLTV
jgi:malate permease and related proteins